MILIDSRTTTYLQLAAIKDREARNHEINRVRIYSVGTLALSLRAMQSS